jgi:hypothetical protein
MSYIETKRRSRGSAFLVLGTTVVLWATRETSEMTTITAQQSSPSAPGTEDARLRLHDRLALISLIDEGARSGCSDSPMVADLFAELGNRVDVTVHGAKIDRLKPDSTRRGFRILEINADSGENLGRLNMLYLNKPIPCYYLVYVEVATPFRSKGLGNRILQAFRDFLTEKSAVGILDNIIPQDDPTYDIYLKLNWQPVSEITRVPPAESDGVYMVHLPPCFAAKDLRDPLLKLLHHLKRKRPAIDMRDNELMVERTIEEFKDLYAALLTYFGAEIDREESSSLMRFMFTRFVTKLLGFRRRIGQLLGYTGGESLQQIVVHPEIRSLPVQSYAPRELTGKPSCEFGDKELWLNLPEEFKQFPARMVDGLSNYLRPSLTAWLEETGKSASDPLTIGDLLDLGFDPTRLKEITLADKDYIFERVQARMLPRLKSKANVLQRLAPELAGARIKNAMMQANLPLLVIRDRGNGYVLRHKVEGIHWEEALEQIHTVPQLQELSRSTRLERLILATVRQTVDWVRVRLSEEEQGVLDDLSYFISWDVRTNQPGMAIDYHGSSIQSVWIA